MNIEEGKAGHPLIFQYKNAFFKYFKHEMIFAV
jgi:hypothetical protein